MIRRDLAHFDTTTLTVLADGVAVFSGNKLAAMAEAAKHRKTAKAVEYRDRNGLPITPLELRKIALDRFWATNRADDNLPDPRYYSRKVQFS